MRDPGRATSKSTSLSQKEVGRAVAKARTMSAPIINKLAKLSGRKHLVVLCFL